MYGTNKRISFLEVTRTITDTGAVSAEETETLIAGNVPATIQSHVLNNLPPPSDRPTSAGIFYLREFRCWVAMNSIPNIVPHTTWLVMDEATGEKYRIRAVIDDAGRGHHWLIRMENYDG